MSGASLRVISQDDLTLAFLKQFVRHLKSGAAGNFEVRILLDDLFVVALFKELLGGGGPASTAGNEQGGRQKGGGAE